MADDQSQRPYRASEPPPARGSSKTSGSDPLAELARLIGQTDPFGEFGREPARRSPPQPAERANWNTRPLGTPYTAQYGCVAQTPEPASKFGGNGNYSSPAPASQASPRDYVGQNYGRQSYGGVPPADADQYQDEHEAQGYPPEQADYQHEAYDQAPVEEEYYEDFQPSRRRLAVWAIAGVLALAVIGTAGAFGYRALFGSATSNKPPPVIKADTGPSKIVPATTGKDAQSNKLITERVNERGQSEKLVSREEQPLDRPTAVALPQGASQSALGSGVVTSEPKKIRTIAIHPDPPVGADAAPSSLSAAPAPARPTPAPRVAAAPERPAPDNATADTEDNAPQAAPTRAAPPARQAAPASNNAPLSLNPNGAPARAAAAPTRTASVAPQAPQANAAAGGAGSFVQVSSQRSETEAQAAFQSLQAKFPDQLGNRQASIHKVDLGAKGTFYRAMVGPFANANEASQLCSSLKAAGGQCLIQRN